MADQKPTLEIGINNVRDANDLKRLINFTEMLGLPNNATVGCGFQAIKVTAWLDDVEPGDG